MLKKEDVEHLAKLARIKLTEKESKNLPEQLSNILKYVEQLNEVDTTDVEETSQVTGLENVVQKDEVKGCENPEELLECSPLPKERHQVRVKSVITEN